MSTMTMVRQAVRPSTAAALKVTESVSAEAWDRYVARKQSLFHRAGWDRVWRVYRLPVHRLAAVRGEGVVGVLPLVHQRSPLTGNQLVSLPWFDAAGVLADEREASRLLVDAAQRMAEKVGANWVQVRHTDPEALSPYERTDKVLMRLKLAPTAAEFWDGLKPKVRNQVRKAEKSGLEAAVGGAELLSEFFGVYARNMRDLGSPSHNRRLFEAVLEAFPAESRVYVVRHGKTAVGAGFTMANGDTLEIPWASSLKSHNGLCVNHLMYWRILSDACESAYEWFHFGRSTKGSGQHHFKEQWGAEEVPLHWHFLSRDHRVAAGAAAPPQERLGRGAQMWQKLPVWAAKTLGPWLISGIP